MRKTLITKSLIVLLAGLVAMPTVSFAGSRHHNDNGWENNDNGEWRRRQRQREREAREYQWQQEREQRERNRYSRNRRNNNNDGLAAAGIILGAAALATALANQRQPQPQPEYYPSAPPYGGGQDYVTASDYRNAGRYKCEWVSNIDDGRFYCMRNGQIILRKQ